MKIYFSSFKENVFSTALVFLGFFLVEKHDCSLSEVSHTKTNEIISKTVKMLLVLQVSHVSDN